MSAELANHHARALLQNVKWIPECSQNRIKKMRSVVRIVRRRNLLLMTLEKVKAK